MKHEDTEKNTKGVEAGVRNFKYDFLKERRERMGRNSI